MEIKLFWAGFVVGAFVYIVSHAIFKHFQTVKGVLKIDKSNLEKDLYRLEIDDLDAVEKKKHVELVVSIINSIPQK